MATYTQTDLDNLKEALVSGAEEIRVGDRMMRIRSQKELLQLIQIVKADLASEATSGTSASLIQATYKKGQT